MSSKKKFETLGGGYSAIGKVFERDAAISKRTEIPKEKLKEAQAEPVNEPVVEVVPVAPLIPRGVEGVKPRSTRIAPTSKGVPRKVRPVEPECTSEEKTLSAPKRSTRAGGRLPAVRVECLPDEFSDIEQLVFNLGRAAGYKVSNNIVGRALFRLALEAEDEIRKILEKRPPRPRPSNGDAEDLAKHEDEWQQVIAEAMRSLRVRR